MKKSFYTDCVRRLKELRDLAKFLHKGFVFGWDFYDADEAYDAMVANFVSDMKSRCCSFTEVYDGYLKCMCKE